MTPAERDAWLSYLLVTKSFLGNTKADNYLHLVNYMLEKFKRLHQKEHQNPLPVFPFG